MAAISSERSRPVKLSLQPHLLTLSAASAEQGTATEELDGDRVNYDAGALEIGFQARYLNDITDQITDSVEFQVSPTVRRRRSFGMQADESALVCSDANAGVGLPGKAAFSNTNGATGVF